MEKRIFSRQQSLGPESSIKTLTKILYSLENLFLLSIPHMNSMVLRILFLSLLTICSCYYQIFAQKTKNQNYKDWKKFNSINILSRDITFISDSILGGYNNLIFAHKKPFAIWVKDGENVGIWSRDSLYRRDSLWKFKDIQDIRISPDDKMLAIITYDSGNTGFLVHFLDLQTYLT